MAREPKDAPWCGILVAYRLNFSAAILSFAFLLCPLVAQTTSGLKLDVLVTDPAGHPLNSARVEVMDARGTTRTGETDTQGHILFTNLRPGRYTLRGKVEGWEAVEKSDLDLEQPLLAVQLVLVPPFTHNESVEVRGTVVEVEEDTSVPNKLPPEKARELPSRPATVADALPLIPGVVREPGGGLVLSSSPEHRSALIVNSADVTDPATGQFGLTVPIDSVEVLNVYQTAYLAEYGRFTAGLVSVETKRGGDKWKWELNDPLPEFRIRSWHLRGLKTATPRLNFEGPLIANKLFLSEGFEYEIRKTEVFTQPFPYNQKTETGLNSFTQLDWVASDRHLVTATMHAAPRKLGGVGMDFYNPLSTTPDMTARNYTGTVFDRLTLWRGLLENRLSITKFDGRSWGLGPQDLTLAPAGNTGNFFAGQNRSATRISGASTYQFAPLSRWGTHQFKMGGYLASSEHDGDINENPVDIVDFQRRLLSRVAFGQTQYHNFEVDDLEKSFFGQDHWILTPKLAADLGLRTESQQISGAFRVAPRFGFAFTPFAGAGTVLRGGLGWFYDRVPLNVYGANRYPSRLETFYDPQTGDITGGPYRYAYTLGQNVVRFPFVSQKPIDGNFSPRSSVWSVQLEQPVTHFVRLRATYLQNFGDGLVVVRRVAPDPSTNIGALLLEGNGSSRYKQFDVTAQLRLKDDRQLFFSYTRSSAWGDLNDFGQFLGTVPAALVRQDMQGRLPTDLPNRFLTWGVIRLPLKFQIAPVVELRSGFPYLATDALQNYAGVPYGNRYPTFFSFDSRFSKDLQLTPKYAVRVSISSFNLTNHFNPEAVRSNIADPAYGFFFAQRGRRFTADLDFLF